MKGSLRQYLAEILACAGWWIRLEIRKGQGLFAVVLFTTVLLVSAGLVMHRVGLPVEGRQMLYWITYTFALFQAIPRPLLERRLEEWRWLYQLFSPVGLAGGLLLYTLGLTAFIGALLIGGAHAFWQYGPPLLSHLIGGAVLGLPLSLTAFLAARAEASYTIAAVLGFPLLLFPLLWLTLRSNAPLLPLALLLLLEGALFFLFLPSVWRD